MTLDKLEEAIKLRKELNDTEGVLTIFENVSEDENTLHVCTREDFSVFSANVPSMLKNRIMRTITSYKEELEQQFKEL